MIDHIELKNNNKQADKIASTEVASKKQEFPMYVQMYTLGRIRCKNY